MSSKLLLTGAVLALLSPAAAFAQQGAGTAAGATTGAVGGAIVGGPVGAVVGGVTGAIVGGIADQQPPQFRQYVIQQDVPSYRYTEEVRVGVIRQSRDVPVLDERRIGRPDRRTSPHIDDPIGKPGEHLRGPHRRAQ